jgi:protein associated with RNAse G/E
MKKRKQKQIEAPADTAPVKAEDTTVINEYFEKYYKAYKNDYISQYYKAYKDLKASKAEEESK